MEPLLLGSNSVLGRRPWTPADYANTFLWLDPGAISGSNGDNVTTIPDSTGNGRTAAIGTGVSLNTSGLNGHNILNINNLLGPVGSLATNALNGITEGSLYVVMKRTLNHPASGPSSGGIFYTGSANYSASGNHYPYTDDHVYDGTFSDTRKDCGDPTLDLSTWHIASWHSKNGLWEFYLNDVLIYQTFTNTFGASATTYIFRGQSTSYFDGLFAGLLITSLCDAAANRHKMIGALAHRFAIASILDAGHLYRTNPPTM